MDIYQHSIQIILQNQHKSGAYIASPAFPNYRYCWLRDGSFIAHAMDRAGEHQSAEAYFRWVDQAIQNYAYKVEQLEEQLKKGAVDVTPYILHTRYTLEGEEENTDSTWGNFQIDGYGSWLWALAMHIRQTGNDALLSEFSGSIHTTIRYLKATWQLPNYDCWEEHPEFLHPYSLSAVYGGLKAIADIIALAKAPFGSLQVDAFAEQVKEFLDKNAKDEGKFAKHLQPADLRQPARPVQKSGIDASLLGLAVPYQVFGLHDPAVLATVQAIEKELWRPGGGVYRYKEDVYYGGGEWLLLAAWLGWYCTQVGETGKAQDLRVWIEKQVDRNGNMPEQVSECLLAPEEFQLWVDKWGPVATPLLWSHAMYIILVNAIQEEANC